MSSFLHNGDDVLMLVDAHALLYRAYYAFPNLTTSTGLLINASFGFTRILLKAIASMQPTHLAVIYDHPKPTFRHQQYKEYKAHREKMPIDLIPQVELIKKIVKTLNIPQFELAGFEADDLIGSLSRQATVLVEAQKKIKQKKIDQKHTNQKISSKLKTIIVTGDQDLFQLINDVVHVWLPGRVKLSDQEYDYQAVYQKLGIYPQQVIDMKALMGDSSDNIPGIAGIGYKTAVKLMQAFGSLTGVFQAVTEVAEFEKLQLKDKHLQPSVNLLKMQTLLKGALLRKLQTGYEQALLSQKLATIDQAVPIKLNLQKCRVSSYDKEQVIKLFQELEFRSMINMLPNDEFETSIQESLF